MKPLFNGVYESDGGHLWSVPGNILEYCMIGFKFTKDYAKRFDFQAKLPRIETENVEL